MPTSSFVYLVDKQKRVTVRDYFHDLLFIQNNCQLSFLQISLVKYHYGLIELNSVAAVYAYLSYHAVKFALYFASLPSWTR